ncbi:MAG: biotin/lipoyl-containing protein [Candidatus Kapaibacterium sp.]
MEIKFNNEIHEIIPEKRDDGFVATIGGEIFDAKATAANANTIIFRRGGRTFAAFAAQDAENYYVVIDGRPFVFEKPKDEEKSFESAADNGNRQDVTTPMPGSVVKVEVEVGQEVKEGDPLVIVEAMKMETSLFASIDGVVTKISATAGEQVDSDTVLVVVEKPDSEE